MIDTHCHLNFDAYADDLSAVIQRAEQAGVALIINPGVDVPSSQEAIALAQQYNAVFAAVGIHPNSTAAFQTSDLAALCELAAAPRVVAIGEIGLDYYWDKSPVQQQRAAFEQQLVLAADLRLPVIIHNREASEDVIVVLESWAAHLPAELRGHAGVLHSVSAPPDIAERALAAGFYLGFTGPITYKNADTLRAIARQTPLDRILVETDGPFLTPIPHRGKRNEPAYIPYIVDTLAGLKQLSASQMADITTANAVRLFHLTL
jgi:TatD DNase family protein